MLGIEQKILNAHLLVCFQPLRHPEQLVTDYLTRVAQAARLLPKGARMAFVGRTRALIEREVGPPGTRTDPEQVMAAAGARLEGRFYAHLYIALYAEAAGDRARGCPQ